MTSKTPTPNQWANVGTEEFRLEMQARNLRMAKKAGKAFEESGRESHAKLANHYIATYLAYGGDLEILQACMNS